MRLEQQPFVWSVLQLQKLAGWQHELVGSPAEDVFTDVVIDSRKTSLQNALFVAIRGNKHDGHTHLFEVAMKGALGIVIEDSYQGLLPVNVHVFRVASTRQALAELATLKRKNYMGCVIALTGSMGKTSTKTFVKQLLQDDIYCNPGNLNNEIGVPLSIFAADMQAKTWLLEFGMNHAGEIDRLTQIAQPNWGVLLAPGSAHQGNFNTAEDIIAAKAELITSSAAPQKVFIADHRYLPYVKQNDLICIGNQLGDAWQITQANYSFPRGLAIKIQHKKTSMVLQTELHGKHWQLPVATAWAIASSVQPQLLKNVTRTGCLATLPGRMQLIAYQGGWLLDDSYNASLESYLAVLDFVQPLAKSLHLCLLVGDMLEVGRFSESFHAQVAKKIKKINPNKIIVVGKALAHACKNEQIAFNTYQDPQIALKEALSGWQPGFMLLSKAANGMGIYQAIQDWRS